MERANPFGDLAAEFSPKKTPAKPVEPAQIERLAEDNGFPSRQRSPLAKPADAPTTERPRRRYTTGRNQQLNVKATAETVDRFYRLADKRAVTLGELLELALKALEAQDRASG